MNKYALSILLLISLSISSCFKKDTCVAIKAAAISETEYQNLTNFVKDIDADAIYDTRGFYYRIVKSGSINKPGICSDIYASYECSDGKDKMYYQSSGNTPIVFDLSYQNQIWRYAFPLIGMGGEIILYCPPSLRKTFDATTTSSNVDHTIEDIEDDANVVYKLRLVRWN